MTLPRPRYTTTGLDAWLDAAALPLPLPPTPPDTWTCLFTELGVGPLQQKDDRGITEIDAEFLQALLAACGRPVRKEEREPVLLATPIPSGRPIGALLTGLLRHTSYAVRQRAALTLGWSREASAAPDLVRALRDEDNDVRRAACEAIGWLGVVELADELVRTFDDPDSSVDAAKIEALARLGAWSRVAGALEGASEENDAANLARAVLRAEEGDGVEDLVPFLTHSEDGLRRATARYLASRPTVAEEALEPLLALLQSEEDGDVGVVAAEACGRAGEEAVGSLAELLGDTGWKVRMFAAAGLAWADDVTDAVEALTGLLSDDDSDVRREAAFALTVHGKGPATARDALRRSVAGTYRFPERARRLAARQPIGGALGMLLGDTPPGAELLAVLTAQGDDRMLGHGALLLALAEPDLAAPVLEAAAVETSSPLGSQGRRFASAGLLLTGTPPSRLGIAHRLLLAHDGQSGSSAGGSLAGVAPRAGELALLAVTSTDWQARLDALKLLQMLGPDVCAPYQPFFAHIAKNDTDNDCRDRAGEMLPARWQDPSAGADIATLVVGGSSASEEVRLRALRALSTTQPRLAAELARSFIDGYDRTLARAGAEVLGQLATGDAVTGVIEAGMAALAHDSWVTREAGCELLASIPRDALPTDVREEIVEALLDRASGDDDNDVQSAAKSALARYGVELAGGEA